MLGVGVGVGVGYGCEDANAFEKRTSFTWRIAPVPAFVGTIECGCVGVGVGVRV